MSVRIIRIIFIIFYFIIFAIIVQPYMLYAYNTLFISPDIMYSTLNRSTKNNKYSGHI